VIESFAITPTEIEITSNKPTIAVELVVSHPYGIAETSVFASVSNGTNLTYRFPLTRIETPINFESPRVIFRGSYTLPSDLEPGNYEVSADGVKNNWSAGYQFQSTAPILVSKSMVIGTENSLIVRKQGLLNLTYDTFLGPTHDLTKNFSYSNPSKYFFGSAPTWKVGENYDPNDFFEVRVKNLPLQIESGSPTICPLDGKILKFIKEGVCKFTVRTPKTLDYVENKTEVSVNILSARIQSTLSISPILNQTVDGLPKILSLPLVASPASGWVLPNSLTPSVCSASGFTVKIISGGTCRLSYQTSATEDYLASPLYIQAIEITKNSQTMAFSPAASVTLVNKTVTLAATASGGGVVTFTATPGDICSVTGSTLNLLKPGGCSVTATQAGTGTIASVTSSRTVTITGAVPVVKKTISCVKGSKTIKKTAISPKCPAGYKVKK
jgi:hypothetical protein